VLRPRGKATVVVAPSSDGADLGLLFGSRGVDIRLARGDLASLADVLTHLSGAFAVDEIAARTGVSSQSVSGVVDRLSSAGLVYDYGPADADAAIDPAVLVATFESLAGVLRFDMFRHSLFAALEVDERLFVAASAEYFHLIRDAHRHTTLARDHAPPELRELIEEYRVSEQDHYKAIGSRLLEALGGAFSLDDLAPLASTESLLLKTHELARTDTLAYLACCSFAEAQAAFDRSGRSDTAAAPTEIGATWPPATRALLGAFVDHAGDDHGCNHARLFARGVALARETIGAAHAERILTAVHQFKHGYDNLNFEIERVFTQRGAPLPRLRPRLADYLDTP
jgi:hypothetical protein